MVTSKDELARVNRALWELLQHNRAVQEGRASPADTDRYRFAVDTRWSQLELTAEIERMRGGGR